MMHTHRIPGLRFTTLTEYLAGLGLLSVVASQMDESATAGWLEGAFTIRTTCPDLTAFLVEQYSPTPVLAPWSNGSGFGDKDKVPKLYIDLLEKSTSPRLNRFREALAVVRRVLAQPEATKWRDDKGRFVQELRNWLPDDALGWVDASVVLTSSGPAYPPLLGTGGNDGRLDFSTNFHQRLADVLPELGAKASRSNQWASDLFSGITRTAQVSASIGQGDAAAAGGPGSSSYGTASSLVNPWAYVLMIEGATLFASSAARRYGEQHGKPAMPFTVLSSPDGPIPGASAEESRGELWAPVFDSLTLGSLRQILQEARATWDGSSARTAVAMYGALRTYGVARGIERFQRFGFLQRNGLSFVATPLDTVDVVHWPEASAAQRPMRRAQVFSRATGAATALASRKFNAAATAFVRDPSWSSAISMLGRQTLLEVTATRSRSNQEALYSPGRLAAVMQVLPVVSGLLRDRPEARIAAGIASGLARTSRRLVPTRELLIGAFADKKFRPAVVPGLGDRSTIDVLADLMLWLAQHADADDARTTQGWLPWVTHRYRTWWTDTHAWVGGLLDDDLLGDCLLAFLALDWHSKELELEHLRDEPMPVVHVEPTLAVLQALASGRGVLPGHEASGPGGVRGLDTSWPMQLRANQVSRVRDLAAARARRTKFITADHSLISLTVDLTTDSPPLGHGPRILAGLATSASTKALQRFAPDHSEIHTTLEGESS